mgnify:CR=1 FL=1
MICLFPGWSQKAIRLLPCSIALLVSGCIGVTAVTGNLPRPSLRSCESNAPVPARVEIEMLESSAFQIMHRNNFDNSDLERKSKDAIALMLLRHIQKHPNLTNDPGANTTVRITLRLIDPGEDNYDSGLSSLSAVLGCFTLYVIPFYQELGVGFQKPVFLLKQKIGCQTKKVDFFKVADMHLTNLKNRGNHHQYDTEVGRLNKFKTFLRKKELSFNELNVPLLKNFEAYLLHDNKRSPRTVVNYLILIRTIYNLAISESLVDRGRYPFGKGKVQIKIPETQKIGFNIEEIQKLENATDLTEAQQKAVHVWLISFYFAGIRVGDVLRLKWSDFNDGRLMYRMNKNSKLVTLKIPDKANAILKIYQQNYSLKNDLIFDYLNFY